MFLHVTRVRHLKNYELRLTFNDGSVRDIDLKNELYGEVFEPSREIDFFERVFINPDTGTIEWPNGADLAPEFLHEIGTQVEAAAQAA